MSALNVQCSVASTLSGISAHYCFVVASCARPFLPAQHLWLFLVAGNPAKFEHQPNIDVSCQHPSLPAYLISTTHCLCPFLRHRCPSPLPPTTVYLLLSSLPHSSEFHHFLSCFLVSPHPGRSSVVAIKGSTNPAAFTRTCCMTFSPLPHVGRLMRR